MGDFSVQYRIGSMEPQIQESSLDLVFMDVNKT